MILSFRILRFFSHDILISMKTILEEELHQDISQSLDYEFTTEKAGIYMIEIQARAHGEKQISPSATDDDDLKVEIDYRKFPLLTNLLRYSDSPAAFSGGKLHGKKKSVIFLLTLSAGKHKITLVPDNKPTLETIKVSYVGKESSGFSLGFLDEAEDGDGRPWITIVLVDLSLIVIKMTIKAEPRFRDSDDVKIAIDGYVVQNHKGGLRKFWYWLGSIFTGDVKQVSFEPKLKKSLHYVELFADRKPSLMASYVDFGKKVRHVPSVYDPTWNGDFNDDSDVMILSRAIFGEARNLQSPDKLRVAVGWTIKNRVNNPSWWGNSYHSAITKPRQYSAFNQGDPNRKYVESPLHKGNETDRKSWQNCYKIAEQVITGEIEDPTSGATHYYDQSISPPDWASPGNFVIKISTVFFHKP